MKCLGLKATSSDFAAWVKEVIADNVKTNASDYTDYLSPKKSRRREGKKKGKNVDLCYS